MTPTQKSKLLYALKDAISILEADEVKPKKKALNKRELFVQMSKYPNKKPYSSRA